MSLWSHDEYRIVLRPHQVVLARMTRELTLRGWQRRVLEEQVFPCAAAGEEAEPWSAVVQVLGAVLSGLAGRKAAATVILSNHLVRYALIPWSDSLNGAKEEMAYAQHTFQAMYGGDAGSWELRISPGAAGMMQVASAVDARLLAALRGQFVQAGVELRSIQPHLMLAYNACFDTLNERSAWLAVIEKGNLCLALLQEGQWSWIRMMRIGAHWHKELPFLLSREALVANIENNVDEVLLWAPEQKRRPESGERWKIRHLRPALLPVPTPEFGSRFALYLSE